MRKLMLCALAVVMVTVAFSSVAPARENRHRLTNKRGGGVGIQGAEVQKVPEFSSFAEVVAYASFSFPAGDETVEGQPYCGPEVGSGLAAAAHTFLTFGIGIRPDGSITIGLGPTLPVAPESCSTSCTPFPTTGFSGTFTLGGVVFNLLAVRPNQVPGFDVSTGMRLRVLFEGAGTLLQIVGLDACGL